MEHPYAKMHQSRLKKKAIMLNVRQMISGKLNSMEDMSRFMKRIATGSSQNL
jgi:hypothetical protein